jgi:fucose permease
MRLIPQLFVGIFFGLFLVFTLFGTSMTIVGAALPRILSDFGWSYASAGSVIAVGAAAYFLASLVSGKVIKRIGSKATILLGVSLCVIGLAFFASSPAFLLNFALNAIIGAGQGLIEPVVSWSALKMDEEGSGKPMNLMHGAFAIGAVAGPIALGLIMRGGLSWTLLFRVIALLLGICGLVLALLPFSRLGQTEEPKAAAAGPYEGGTRGKKRTRGAAYWLGFMCLLLYVGAETGISNWIAEYFVRIFGAEPAYASLAVSLFWAGLLSGRFGIPLSYRGKRPERLVVAFSLLLVAATGALCALGFVVRADSPLWAPSVLTFASGLGCSIIYPTVISLVGGACRGYQSEAVSFAISGGGLGLFAFPFLMSAIAQAFEIRVGFAFYAFIAILTAISCAVLAKTIDRTRMRMEEMSAQS